MISTNIQNVYDGIVYMEQYIYSVYTLFKTKTIRKRKVSPAILLFSSNLLLNSNIAGGTFPILIVFVLTVPVSAEGRIEH